MRGVDSRDAILVLVQTLGPSYSYELFGGWRLVLLMYFSGGHISMVVGYTFKQMQNHFRTLHMPFAGIPLPP